MVNIASIPPGVRFLPTLAGSLLGGTLPGLEDRPQIADDPFALSDITVLLPTRRAARGLREAFAEAAGGASLLLPTIGVVGDIGEDPDLAFRLPLPGGAHDDVDERRAMGECERLLTLAHLVDGWLRSDANRRRDASSVGVREVLALTGELTALLDQVTTEQADWRELAGVVPEEFAAHWQSTLAFLQIATEAWPQILAERGLNDPVAHREALLMRAAERLRAGAPEEIVISAGTFGSSRGSLELISAIAGLPRGLVVLPGLDRQAGDGAWAAIGMCDGSDPAQLQAHPQYAIKRFLAHAGGAAGPVDRADVPEIGSPRADLRTRERLLSAALSPASKTAEWRSVLDDIPEGGRLKAVGGLSLMVAHNAREEALAVAIVLREALQDPDCRVAVVTPDRALGRRIAVELKRWGIEADDSAGRPLARLEAGSFAQLVAARALGDGDPHTLLALLKHPLCTIGRRRIDVLDLARTIERTALRVLPLKGRSEKVSDRIVSALAAEDVPQPRQDRLRAALALLADLDDALALLAEPALAGGTVEVSLAAEALSQALQALRRPAEGEEAGLPTPDDLALQRLLDELIAVPAGTFPVKPAGLPDLLAQFMAVRRVNRPLTSSHRVSIWGSLEARLQTVDKVVLAGLNEGSWPGGGSVGPFLSRTMRGEIGLAAPERLIGLAAHDFQQLMGVPEVVLSRSERDGSSPSVASRLLQRFLTLVGEDLTRQLARRGETYLRFARRLDAHGGDLEKVDRPAPTPPVALRPKRLSVTEIETLIRDPYAIYAKHVLRLKALEPIAGKPGVAERGSLYHDILQVFFEMRSGAVGPADLDALLAIADDQFSLLDRWPDLKAAWWPRFRRIAAELLVWENQRSQPERRCAEARGEIDLEIAGEVFRLTGRADRIDLVGDGSCHILDYKTGAPPNIKQVNALIAPQLPLEAWMVGEGAFGGIDAAVPSELIYLQLSGANPPVKNSKVAPNKDKTTEDLVLQSSDQLKALIAKYAFAPTGYLSRARPMRIRYPSDYDHLARVAEWQLDAGDDSDDGGEA